ncbi:hypothetical protein I0D00_02170 [Pseudomonas lalucatii]|uniref:SPOR domain-containing protein n=1 Tax=Pseudomonas lalucatii TaxID=1424203 RepID=A0ABS5PW74_9PSED|nr:hypothetical protein [Pseudomonas lalucatii]MBS7660755.1 hypothetical protein [Pseudomonas lalucatii]MBS7691410.1 hypothetical protein [Pseudomonas lalucatii]MBS7724467.1 hypothetical protein [Pseudomonas lalucatii]QVM87534.1 hypothetical protein I0D68_21150 [Pseudomonas lalucatii]
MSTAPRPQHWCLMRLDDNGNEFVVREGLSRAAAEALAREFEARGHKQSYWARPQPPASRDEQ